ncbi:TerB family tellurite resistance protein [Polyangium sp. y55x31]|uniref:TerB family tellurite resistance protein n=1 Tax=Polyangium sp. y55x31 TaxID=3042688 RepID=UPI0024824D75|nr:TerB family tellurite resistance protein [Polyangium sp. y55x31]MDI1479851.1 TerB family tellurite resistance protein [Polyangium sp. y55x31]
MGLFDGFGNNRINLTPQLALVAGMIYISAADGQLDDSEAGDILKVVPDRRVLEEALNYVRRTPYQQFLDGATRVMSPAQKMCLILNAADMAMGDGYLAPQEQQMLVLMAQVFQIPDAHLHPYIQAFMIKNNLTVFQ